MFSLGLKNLLNDVTSVWMKRPGMESIRSGNGAGVKGSLADIQAVFRNTK